MPRENVSSGLCGQQMPRPACGDASTQSDQGLCCLLTELLVTTDGTLYMHKHVVGTY